MQLCKHARCAECLIMCLLVTVVGGQAQLAVATGAVKPVDEKLCQRLRQELSLLVQQAYAQSSYPVFMKEMLPDWTEVFLPRFCRKRWNGSTINSPNNEHTGSRRTTSQFRVSDFARIKHQNMFNLQKNTNDKGPKEVIPNGQDTSRNDVTYIHGGKPVYRVKRFLVDGSYRGADFPGMPLKKFNPSPARQPTPFAQMFDNFMKNLNPHRTTLANSNPTLSLHGGRYSLGKTNVGPLAFGNAFRSRNKREVSATKSDQSGTVKRRTKRFLLGEMAEYQPMPSMFSIMMGTAQDPNTGKPIEFGGDVMRNMIVNSFTSLLPPSAQPPPGKEPNELVQIMAPMWYFSNMQQTMNSLQSSNSGPSYQKRNRNGYYGDIVPGKRRKK